jgi:hypothetical protein
VRGQVLAATRWSTSLAKTAVGMLSAVALALVLLGLKEGMTVGSIHPCDDPKKEEDTLAPSPQWSLMKDVMAACPLSTSPLKLTSPQSTPSNV